MSIFSDWVVRELKKRASVPVDAEGDLPAGKVLLSTGVGSRTTPTDIPIVGGWVVKNEEDFQIEEFNHYIVTAVSANRTATLPLNPSDKMTVILKVTVSEATSLFIQKYAGTTYTIANESEPLEIDYTADITLVYDQVSNNWTV